MTVHFQSMTLTANFISDVNKARAVKAEDKS